MNGECIHWSFITFGSSKLKFKRMETKNYTIFPFIEGHNSRTAKVTKSDKFNICFVVIIIMCISLVTCGWGILKLKKRN